MNSRSIAVLVLYATLMTGLTAAIAKVGAAMARQTAGLLVLADRPDQPVSRVEKGLEVQARVSDFQPVSHVIELHAYPATDASAVALASAMDTAEGADLPDKAFSATAPKLAARAVKPRVAGWIRRAPRVSVPPIEFHESTAQLIQRHLRAEM